MTQQTLPAELGKPDARHLYAVEVIMADGTRRTVDVHAHNRDYAARLVERFDVTAASVNMIG